MAPKDIIKKVKILPIEWEEIYAYYISDEH